MCVGGDVLVHDEPADGWRRQIQNDDIGRVVVEPVKRGRAISGFFHVKSLLKAVRNMRRR